MDTNTQRVRWRRKQDPAEGSLADDVCLPEAHVRWCFLGSGRWQSGPMHALEMEEDRLMKQDPRALHAVVDNVVV